MSQQTTRSTLKLWLTISFMSLLCSTRFFVARAASSPLPTTAPVAAAKIKILLNKSGSKRLFHVHKSEMLTSFIPNSNNNRRRSYARKAKANADDFSTSSQNNYLNYKHTMTALRVGQNTSNEIDPSGTKEEVNKGYKAAQQAVTLLAQRNKTWNRLSPIVELATSNANASTSSRKYYNQQRRPSIADIGCDHGLLSIALASSGEFDTVIGIDVSERALQDGALAFYSKVKNVLEIRTGNDNGNDNEEKLQCEFEQSLPLEFRFGDGLIPLHKGEADSICIAGMGVSTMLSILQSPTPFSDCNGDVSRYLDYLQCSSLFLQPPTSRPRKLMKLYNEVQNMGFVLANERIVKLKKIWYITSQFDRRQSFLQDEDCHLLPGHYLSKIADVDQQREYKNYIDHHLQWLNEDLESGGELCDYEKEWRAANCQKQ